jgi:hypothetical protein
MRRNRQLGLFAQFVDAQLTIPPSLEGEVV